MLLKPKITSINTIVLNKQMYIHSCTEVARFAEERELQRAGIHYQGCTHVTSFYANISNYPKLACNKTSDS